MFPNGLGAGALFYLPEVGENGLSIIDSQYSVANVTAVTIPQVDIGDDFLRIPDQVIAQADGIDIKPGDFVTLRYTPKNDPIFVRDGVLGGRMSTAKKELLRLWGDSLHYVVANLSVDADLESGLSGIEARTTVENGTMGLNTQDESLVRRIVGMFPQYSVSRLDREGAFRKVA